VRRSIEPGNHKSLPGGDRPVDAENLPGVDDDLFAGADVGRRDFTNRVAPKDANANVEGALDSLAGALQSVPPVEHDALHQDRYRATDGRKDRDRNRVGIVRKDSDARGQDPTGGRSEQQNGREIGRVATLARGVKQERRPGAHGERQASEVGDCAE